MIDALDLKPDINNDGMNDALDVALVNAGVCDDLLNGTLEAATINALAGGQVSAASPWVD